MVRALLALLLALLALPAAARPHRVASLNLCTDEMLVALADREDIASLSFDASDPDVSLVAAAARTLPNNHGSAEEILRERADLVLAEPGAADAAAALLERLGVRVERLESVERLDRIRPWVRRLGTLLGREDRAEALIGQMDRTLARVVRPAHPATALVYEPQGWSSGPGTLTGDVLDAAGLVNLVARLGGTGYARLPLEAVVAAPPDLLITESYRSGEVSLAERWLDHPALRALPGRHAEIPSTWLICGTPAIADAVAALNRLAVPALAAAR